MNASLASLTADERAEIDALVAAFWRRSRIEPFLTDAYRAANAEMKAAAAANPSGLIPQMREQRLDPKAQTFDGGSQLDQPLIVLQLSLRVPRVLRRLTTQLHRITHSASPSLVADTGSVGDGPAAEPESSAADNPEASA